MVEDEIARLDAIEAVLGIMLKRMPAADAAAIIGDLRTLIDGTQRNRALRKQAAPALHRLEDTLVQWSGQPPRLKTPGTVHPIGSGGDRS